VTDHDHQLYTEFAHPLQEWRPLGSDIAGVRPRVEVRRALVDHDCFRTVAMFEQRDSEFVARSSTIPARDYSRQYQDQQIIPEGSAEFGQ